MTLRQAHTIDSGAFSASRATSFLKLFPVRFLPGQAPGLTRVRSVTAKLGLLMSLGFNLPCPAKETSNSSLYPKAVEHVLTTYCFDCHGDGMEKGKVAFDQFASQEAMLSRRDLWLIALKN